ncbi:MAG: polysaccharide deacetylase family protein, partial [Gemmatimonadota bacterium]
GRLHPRKVAILSYHNVVPDADPPLGDTSLHLPLSRFRDQMDALMRHFQVVPLDVLLSESVGLGIERGDGIGERHGIRVAITFDDAYRGAMELGLPELASRDLPATVFVCPGLLGNEGFWWDRFADPVAGVVPTPLRSHVLEILGGRQEEAMAWARRENIPLREMPESYRPGSLEEVEEASASCSLGAHTWSHVNLATIPEPEARVELDRSLSWLRKREMDIPHTLSYPYGLSSAAVRGLAARLGFAAGFLVEGGSAAPGVLVESPFLIPRLNIPRGLSLDGFIARVSGFWPW